MLKLSRFSLFITLLFSQFALHAQSCGTRQLDPRIAAFLKRIGNRDLTLEQYRQIPVAVMRKSGPPYRAYPQTDVQRIKITADSIPTLIFNPLHKQNLPIIVFYHGGGFIFPLLPAYEYEIWETAKTFNAIVIAVDYRVAPEYKFPTAVNDSYSAFQWTLQHGQKYGGDTSRIVLMGSSAGANLVAVVSQRAKKQGIANKVKLQVMNGLPIDGSPEHMETSVSYQENATGFMQTKAACYFSVECYAPGDIHKNPEASPTLTDDLSGLPPAVIVNAEFDPLREDGIAYAAKLRKFGVTVWDKCFAGQIHCLIGLPPDSDEIKEYNALIQTAMNATLAKGK